MWTQTGDFKDGSSYTIRMNTHGIIVGCDRNQEWLLDWWWQRYSAHNAHRVAFVDFGMSDWGVAWCRQRGDYIPPSDEAIVLHEVDPKKKSQWDTRAGRGIWNFRAAWFKKPSAFLRAPFPISCWIDLDCEIRGPLDPLFSALGPKDDLAIVPESEYVQQKCQKLDLLLPGEVTYNSGVIVFRPESEIIRLWAEAAVHRNSEFMGDQDALTRLIYLHEPPLVELPAIYNWSLGEDENPEAVILHYVCGWKLEILKQLNSYPATSFS
jgi:hypothetical protein